jgi:hypothetical protein
MSIVENTVCNFRCEICNKNYKDKSGLWYHNKKHNINKNIILPQNTTNSPQNTTNFQLNTTNSPQNTTNIPHDTIKNNIKKLNECIYCNKILSRYDSLKRHEINCKFKINNNFENNEILKNTIKKQSEELNQIKSLMVEQIKEQKKQEIQNQEIKKTLMNLINKNCKVHLVLKNHEALTKLKDAPQNSTFGF